MELGDGLQDSATTYAGMPRDALSLIQAIRRTSRPLTFFLLQSG